MLKEEKNESHDIFARKTNNKMTICLNVLFTQNPKRKRDQLQCTSNQFPNIKPTKHTQNNKNTRTKNPWSKCPKILDQNEHMVHVYIGMLMKC